MKHFQAALAQINDEQVSSLEAGELVSHYDIDNDGKLDFNEFEEVMGFDAATGSDVEVDVEEKSWWEGLSKVAKYFIFAGAVFLGFGILT